MPELNRIIQQVSQNCAISDSRNAGFYSVCGLVLRLRDLYKWEKNLDPWTESDPAEISEWIGNKEQIWEKLAEERFVDINIGGTPYDPLDTYGINSALVPSGYFYGAGYAQSLKPTFFIAAIEEQKKFHEYPLFILGQELARDLLTVPALVQDDCIVFRKETAKLFFWNQLLFVNKSGRPALRFALQQYGVEESDLQALKNSLAMIFKTEMQSYLYHELGEIKDIFFERRLWREIIASYPHSPIELLVRAVKDLLADTSPHGMLRFITKERRKTSLAFYVAFLEGFGKRLFPEIIESFKAFTSTNDWSAIERASAAGYNRARQHARTISQIFLTGKQKNDIGWAEKEIKAHLLAPLEA